MSLRLFKTTPSMTIALAAVQFVAVASAQDKPIPNKSPIQSAERKSDPEEVLKVETNLVPLRVTVTDQLGRAVTGLKKEDFNIYEDGVKQSIDFFSEEEAPASWGLVLDRSTSMSRMIRDVYRAALHVIDEGTNQDDMFVVTFNEKATTNSDFTLDRQELEDSIHGLRADGNTAWYDAVDLALDKMKDGKHKKKVLVLVTDGEDNSSRLKFRRLIERAQEEGVLIYAVGMFDETGIRRIGAHDDARKKLTKLSEATGAFAHFPKDIEGCRNSMDKIAREVSQQYTLGYYPTIDSRDGNWRKIRVVIGVDSKTKYMVRTRAGYHAPKGDKTGNERAI